MAEFSVFVQFPAHRFAVDYYEFYGMDGRLRVSPPIHRVASFLELLNGIVTQGNQWVIIVSHGNPNGLVMRLVDRRNSGNATSDALAILLKIHIVRERAREIRDRPGERQPEDLLPVLNIITSPPGAGERSIDTLFNPPQADTSEVQRLRSQLRQARETFAQRRAEARRLPPDQRETELQSIDQQERQFLADALRNFETMLNNWITAQANAMSVRVSDVDELIDAMQRVHGIHLKRVLVRGCNLGGNDDERTPTALCYFLGAEILDAPKVYTVFGPLRVGIGERRPPGLARAGRLSICGQEDVRRRRGCWWTFEVNGNATDAGTIRMHIRHLGGINYTAVAHATTLPALVRWVHAHLGTPRNTLQARRGITTFPVHFLLTAPAVFPLDEEWTRHVRRVLGLR
jgi:hypothetical protein